ALSRIVTRDCALPGCLFATLRIVDYQLARAQLHLHHIVRAVGHPETGAAALVGADRRGSQIVRSARWPRLMSSTARSPSSHEDHGAVVTIRSVYICQNRSQGSSSTSVPSSMTRKTKWLCSAASM